MTYLDMARSVITLPTNMSNLHETMIRNKHNNSCGRDNNSAFVADKHTPDTPLEKFRTN
jgi:hypothetical protein